jgi:hypothetical protein
MSSNRTDGDFYEIECPHCDGAITTGCFLCDPSNHERPPCKSPRPEAEGTKHDAEKPRYDLIPFKALGVTVDVLTFGAGLYGAENWRKVAQARARYFAAALRHLTAWWLGERNDAKSGKPHLGHAICCLMFLAELEQERSL